MLESTLVAYTVWWREHFPSLYSRSLIKIVPLCHPTKAPEGKLSLYFCFAFPKFLQSNRVNYYCLHYYDDALNRNFHLGERG